MNLSPKRMNSFVFVVCGNNKHINTLNFSLRFINYYSKFPIIVITDSARNETPIEHDNIIDIVTPSFLDNHQASIFLKTSIHNYLDFSADNKYCYLDSDIVAISEEINNIFLEYKSPIIFAKDHCPINEFSPYAINCDCLQNQLQKNKKFAKVNLFFKHLFGERYKESSLDRILLDEEFEKLKENYIRNSFIYLFYLINRYVIPQKKFRFKDYYFDKENKFWHNKSGEIFHFDYRHFEKPLKESTGIHFDKKTAVWKDDTGETISPQIPSCRHLTEYLSREYNIQIPENWQHWNGGVFLFDKESRPFLDYWHKITMEEFNNPYTKTRDQGTLAASVWKFGLQKHSTLSNMYNFITEFDNPKISYRENLGFTENGFKSVFSPFFLHIYHEWGHNGWVIWDFVMDLGRKNKIL